MHHLLRVIASLIAAMILSLPAVASDRAIIILDASGSMWAQINGKARIDIARETLKEVLAGVPDTLELGFMAYGHRSKGDCNDIEMLVQPAAGTADAISAAAAQLSPKGKTPLSASVKMAAEQLKYTEDKATVILITDGLETCDADPCALATELKKAGVDFKVDVVGLALSKKEGEQVRCIADNTGGQYLSADNADGLKTALTTVVTQVAPPAPPPAPPSSSEEKPSVNFAPHAVLDEAGDVPPDDAGIVWEFYKRNADGSMGDGVRTEYGTKVALLLDPGPYIVRGTLGFVKIEQPVDITADAVAQPDYDFEAGFLDVQPIHSEGQPVDSNATYSLTLPNGDNRTGYGEVQNFVPAGTTKITVTIGTASADDTADVVAGQRLEKQVVVGAAHLDISAVYADGGDAVANGQITFEVDSAKKDIQGNRQSIVSGYGPTVAYDVAPGDYTLITILDGAHVETDFSVKAGEAKTLTPSLNAGILAVTMGDGNDAIDVLSANKNIEGKRTDFGGNYGPTAERTLTAGNYHLVITYANNGGTKEDDITIKAGERLEYDATQK